MHGIKDDALKILSDFREAIAKLGVAKERLAHSAFNIAVARKAVATMPAGSDRAFAEKRLTELNGSVNTHNERVAFVNKSAAATWGALKKILDSLGITIPAPALRGGGVGFVQVLPVLAVAALMLAAKKLYDAVVNDTRRIDVEASKLKLLADGKITAGELADAFEKPKGGGLFDDLGKALTAVAVVMILPTVLQAVKARRAA